MTAHQQTARQPQPIAIVGLGAIMPEAPTASAFWANITEGRYCITDVPKDRWDPDLYYDPDPRATGKSYSRIGDGSANSRGTPSAGASRCHPRSAIRWTTARSGRSPRLARRCSTPAGQIGTSTRNGSVIQAVRAEKLKEAADEFDSIHDIRRAMRVGSVDHIISPAQLRPFVIRVLERRLAAPAVAAAEPATVPAGG